MIAIGWVIAIGLACAAAGFLLAALLAAAGRADERAAVTRRIADLEAQCRAWPERVSAALNERDEALKRARALAAKLERERLHDGRATEGARNDGA